MSHFSHSSKSRLSRRRVLIAAGGLAAATALLPLPAMAHRQKLTFTDVRYNGDEQLLEISHRIHLDDAQDAMAIEGITDAPDLTGLRARALFALYVEDQFSIKTAGGPIALELLGAQIEGHYIYVYQQAEMLSAPASPLLIKCEILRALYAGQTNHVNIELGDSVKTLTFSKNDGSKHAG
ncbi:MAG: DUF6702 family protein [Robiginitomaculum sp.]